ncbi:hypothetical protein [uncultured Sunxiuqinia sp.]|uniref:hypothetical protein n=1 Tax=uncultured Sunxiuqinia sp. TaxID=1573825 RepID=UPI002AA87C02|nr:hypothetical protein [uncultured Sunxiuqinia sp.]
MTKERKQIMKRLIKWTLLALFALIIAFSILSFFFAETLIKDELEKQFTKKTNGSYSLSFEDLSVDIFSQSLSISHIGIHDNNSSNAEYLLKADLLKINQVGLYKLLAKRKLHIRKLKIESPSWELKTDTLQQEKSDDPFAFIQKISPLFNTYLRTISIEEIELSNAGFLTGQLPINSANRLSNLNFNIEISNFYTDSVCINREKDFFKADDVYFGIDNYQKSLPDSIHKLSVQKIQYSLKNKDIVGTEIQLTPVNSSQVKGTRYHVEIPEIKIKSNQLREIFQNDSLQIDSLFLMDAQIQVFPLEGAPEINLKKIKEFDLYQLVKGEIRQLKINHLSMNAEKLKIERKKENKTGIQEFYDLEVQLDSLLLSEDSYTDPNRILYSTNLYLEIDNYYLLMNDEIHRFDATSIIVCSKNSFLSADHLQLKPNQNPSTEMTTVDLECDSIRLIDIDLKKLFHKREMPLQSILAYRPTLIINNGNIKRKTQKDTNSLLYFFIRNYIKGVYANLVEFDQGKFTINAADNPHQSGVISSDFSFRLTDFSLDSTSANRTDKLFFATNIDLNFSNYEMKLVDQIHRLKIEQINVSTYQNRATIRNLELSPDKPEMNARLLKKLNRSQIYDIRVPYMSLNNTNIHQAFFNKKLRINRFSIIEPNIYLEVFSRPEKQNENKYSSREFYDLLSNYIENISIKKITTTNGNIQLITHSKKGKTISFNNKFSLELDNFALSEVEIEKHKLLFADDFELKIEDHLFQLSDDVHYLQAKEIGISSKQSEIFIRNAILYPDITSKTKGNLPVHFHISIPEIKLRGVDLEEAYFKQRLAVDQFVIQKPLIDLYRTRGAKNQINFEKVAVPLPKEMHTLIIKKFDINDGQINVIETDQLSEKKILTASISMQGTNNSLISQGTNKPANFNSDNISTTLNQITFKPQKGTVNFTAGQIKFSTYSQKLEVLDLLLKNRSALKNQGFQQLLVPKLVFEQLDIEQVINNKNLHFESIVAENPVMTINSDKTNQDKLNLYHLKIPETISPLINRISAQNINLNQAQVIRLIGEKTKNYPKAQVELANFELDTIASNDLLGAKSVRLNLQNYAFTGPDKYYNFHLGDINFDNQDNLLTISAIQIIPRYSKAQFQKIISFETDHYQGHIDRLTMQNIDLKSWYNRGELMASSIIASGGRLSIYRDKTIADNPNSRSILPQEMIKNIDLPFYFDSLKLEDYNIYYTEQAEKMPLSGMVKFESLNISAYPVTNLPDMLNSNSTLTIKASGLLMGKALLETTMKYNMQSTENEFSVAGKLSPFDLTILNPIVENTAGVSVRSGQLDRFEFEFEANQTHAQGQLRFAYDNLKVSILTTKDGDTREAKFASFIANNLMLKSKHPRTRILLPDEISFNRDPKKSIVNYWWKSIFSGAKNTFGIKE